MRASTTFARLFVRDIAAKAIAGGTTLADALMAVAQGHADLVAKGKVLIGSGSGGTTVSYSLPPVGSLSAEDLAELCSILLDHIDELKAETPAITDPALTTALLTRLQPQHSTRPDFTALAR